ncbi:ABC transporter permease [Dyella sp.]|uniref:ABC transporter permease n=1 Tax=Dyella sp. TaxID=1869338 RepID=UPI002ED40B22
MTGVVDIRRQIGILGFLRAPISSLLRHRSLVTELSKRDVLGRYRGASFGLLWSLISPFLMLGVYTFAFGNVLNSRWPKPEGSEQSSYAIILFIGLIVHGFFAECLSRSPQLVVGNPSYVKRVVFPLEVLPWPMIFSALFHMAMNIVVFIVLRLVIDHAFSWTIILLPLVVLPFVVTVLGLGWLLSAIGVYFRDIGQITGVLATALLFTSSAIVPVTSVAEKYRWIFQWNPLTFIIDQVRDVALWGQIPDWQGLGTYMLGGIIFSYIGYAWFSTTRKGFGDVI